MVEQNPLVSVIIPYFNKVSTIDRSVNSVLGQTYKNWEIIIVDDCSNEKLEYRDFWKDLPITILYNENNLGPGPSRQRALDCSKGEYVAFLDADDWWDLNFIKESYLINLEFPEYSGTWAISKTSFKDREEIRRYSHLNLENIQQTILQYPRPWQTGSILWKRKFCGEWGSFSTSQDYYFELTTSLKNNKLKKIDQVLYFVDQTQGNHRVDLIKRFETNVNTYNLFLFFWDNFHSKLSIKYRIILFHRILRALLKVIEQSEDKTHSLTRFWNEFERRYTIVSVLLRQAVMLKVIHKLLQKSVFKIYF